MSTGMVVCSECAREVHQDGPVELCQSIQGDAYERATWQHCEDKTPLCEDGKARWPLKGEPLGDWCGKDGGKPSEDQ